MKRLVTLLLTLLITTNAHAFGLWGSADMGFGGVSAKTLRADTVAYKTRVEADGGTVIDLASVNTAYKMLADNSLAANALVAVSADWGVKKDGGQAVSKLYSLGGAAYDLIQATGAAQPIWSANGQNGKPIITFNGTSHFMKAAAFTIGSAQVFMAFKPVTWTNSDTIYDGNTLNTMRIFQDGVSPRTSMYSGLATPATPATGVDLSINAWHQITHRWKAGDIQYRIDAVNQTVVQSTGTQNGAGFTLGAYGAGSAPANIVIGEVWVFNAAVTPYTTVEAYLKAKWATP